MYLINSCYENLYTLTLRNENDSPNRYRGLMRKFTDLDNSQFTICDLRIENYCLYLYYEIT